MSATYDLTGKTALVTGASRGNGLLTAQKLARAGADVYLAALDTDAAMESAAAKVRADAPGRRVACGVFDFAELDAPQRMVDAALAALGRIDILVNNAVMRCNRPFGEFSGEEFDRMVAINVRPAFLASQAVLPAMRNQGGGRIVHVASQIGLTLRGKYFTTYLILSSPYRFFIADGTARTTLPMRPLSHGGTDLQSLRPWSALLRGRLRETGSHCLR